MVVSTISHCLWFSVGYSPRFRLKDSLLHALCSLAMVHSLFFTASVQKKSNAKKQLPPWIPPWNPHKKPRCSSIFPWFSPCFCTEDLRGRGQLHLLSEAQGTTDQGTTHLPRGIFHAEFQRNHSTSIDTNHMGASWVIGVPPVIIHFRRCSMK